MRRMAIDQNEVKRIAALAHLEFDEAGLQRIGGELGKILDYIDHLSVVQLSALPSTKRPHPRSGVCASTARRCAHRHTATDSRPR